MNSFDKIIDEAAKIHTDGRRILRRLGREISPQKTISGEEYRLILQEIISLDEGFRRLHHFTNQLYEKAILDPVGLYSKTYLLESVEVLSKEEGLVFLIGDVDKFKAYNDSYGHLQGDIALQDIAMQFRNSIESRLINDERALVARYGGEEFCAFIDHYGRGIEDLHQLVEGVRTDIEKLEISALPNVNFPDEGYKRRTITIAGGKRKVGEEVSYFMQKIDELLIKKDIEGRNSVYIRL